MNEIGPVDYMIVAFPGNEFRGEIAPALAELTDAGTIRIIDLAFVGKNADGRDRRLRADGSRSRRPLQASRSSASRSTACSTRTT